MRLPMRAGLLGVGLMFGGIFLAMGLLILVVLLARDAPGYKFLIPLVFSGGGGGMMALAAMSLPGWARRQEERMEHIGQFTMSLLSAADSRDE